MIQLPRIYINTLHTITEFVDDIKMPSMPQNFASTTVLHDDVEPQRQSAQDIDERARARGATRRDNGMHGRQDHNFHDYLMLQRCQMRWLIFLRLLFTACRIFKFLIPFSKVRIHAIHYCATTTSTIILCISIIHFLMFIYFYDIT